MAKLVRVGSGYELWANTAKAAVEYLNGILTVIEEIKAPVDQAIFGSNQEQQVPSTCHG